MSGDSLDAFSKDPLTEDELRRLRYAMVFFNDHERSLRRLLMVFANWYLLVIGAGLTALGIFGKLVDWVNGSGVGLK